MESNVPLENYLQDTAIIRQTAEQISKEFSFFDLILTFKQPVENPYRTFFEEIKPVMKNLMDSDYQKLYALLYRVDISELQVKKELQANPEKRYEEILTDLCIKRCLQKVVLRKLFS